ncbi:MAG: radical SAM protein [archaeon]
MSHFMQGKPSFVNISVTHRCCLKCRHCDIWKIDDGHEEMTSDEIKTAIRKLRRWLGPFTLNIAGGEPFLRDDMAGIISYASSHDVSVLTTSNGVLIDKKKAAGIVDSGITGISISLEGIKKETHEAIRGHSYDAAVNSLRMLNGRRDGMSLSIATVLCSKNLDEAVQMVGWAEGLRLNGINFQPLTQNFGSAYDPNWHRQSEFWPKDLSLVNRVIDQLIRLKRHGAPIHNTILQLELIKEYFRDPERTVYSCKVGNTNFSVNEYGDVLLCFFMKPVGSILTGDPRKIWSSALADKRRSQISSCKRNCGLLNCNFEN